MDVDVSILINDVDPFDLSASVAERGKNAGPETWANATSEASARPLEVDRDKARDYFRGFGAWEDPEIDAWSDSEVDALILQFAAGDLRELQSLAPGDGLADINWRKAEKLSEHGTVGGRLFPHDGKLLIYIGD